MSNTNNKSIVLNLGMLLIMASGLLFTPLNSVLAANCAGPATSISSGGISMATTPDIAPSAPATFIPNIISNTDAKSVPVEPTYNNNAGTNLGAAAIFGSNSFLPSGLIQWLILAILILAIVVLVRKAYGAEDKYHSSPLKHS
ncbi:MAG: hypothetical protein WCI76_00170 [bacterium]